MRIRAVWILALVVAGTMVSPATIGHAARHAHDAAEVALTVLAPRATYPRNALALLLVRVRNVSPHAVVLAPDCLENPAVEVLNVSGSIVYPPVFPSASAPGRCNRHHHHLPAAILPPGGTVVRRVLAIMRGPIVRPAVTIEAGTTESVVRGPPLRLTLVPGRGPTVTMITSPVLAAVVHPAEPETGQLYYVDLYRCGIDSEFTLSEHVGTWRTARGNRLMPHWPPNCSYPFAWHAIVGWLNQPVGHVDYMSG